MIAEPAPTPAISYAVMHEKADGAINFTASHNPPEYNGIKFSTPDGAPALPEVTQQIEKEIAVGEKSNLEPKAKSSAQNLDPKPPYLARLREAIDVAAIQKAGLRVVFDPLWGAARGYSDSLLREANVNVATVHDFRDVLFGNHAPEPDDHLLEPLRVGERVLVPAHVRGAIFDRADQDCAVAQPRQVQVLGVVRPKLLRRHA